MEVFLGVLFTFFFCDAGFAESIGDADDAYKKGDYHTACLMFLGLSEIGYLYPKNQTETPQCVAALNEAAAITDDGGDAEYLKGEAIADSTISNPTQAAAALRHLEKAAQEGSGKAAFLIYEITKTKDPAEASKWLKKADVLGNPKARDLLARHREEDSRKQWLSKPDLQYVTRLREKYSSRIAYDSEAAAAVVKSFEIDCHAPDKRVLPLLNILYAKMADADTPQGWLEIKVMSRDGEYRIAYVFMTKHGAYGQPTIAFEINKWGELNPVGVRAAAVLNACFGTYGPIWVLPEK